MDPNVQAAALEAAAWAKMLPTNTFQRKIAKAFPVKSEHKATRDEQLGIFGSLTQMGVYQMYRLGRVLAGRYFRYGLLKPHKPCGGKVEVYASNFKRTQLSAQSLLLGLFPKHRDMEDYEEGRKPILVKVPGEGDDFLNIWGKNQYLRELLKEKLDPSSRLNKAEQFPQVVLTRDSVMNTIPVFHYFLRPFIWMSVVDHFRCRSARASARYCFFRRNYKSHQPIITGGMKDFLVEEEDMDPLGQMSIFTDTERVVELFREYDEDGDSCLSKQDVTRLLQEILGVVSPTEKDSGYFFQLLDVDGDGMIRLDEFANFMVESETDYDVYMDQTLGEVKEKRMEKWYTHCKVAETALGWRFHFWFQDKEILSIALSGLVNRLMQSIKATAQAIELNQELTDTPCIHIYAAHDVTILPFFYAIGYWQCPIPTNSADIFKDFKPWPGYGSTVSLELYQDTTVEEPTSDKNWHGWYVKILVWNGIGGEGKSEVPGEEWECPSTNVEFISWIPVGIDPSSIVTDSESPIHSEEVLIPMASFVSWLSKFRT